MLLHYSSRDHDISYSIQCDSFLVHSLLSDQILRKASYKSSQQSYVLARFRFQHKGFNPFQPFSVCYLS